MPKVVNELTPHITDLVDGLLDRIAERGRFDVVRDLAYPLPVAVICRLLGVPLEDEAGVRPRLGAAGAGAGPVLHDHRRTGGGYGGAHRRRPVAAGVPARPDRPAPRRNPATI